MGGKNSPESINRYIAKAYDRINLTVPKGRKGEIKAHATKYDSGSVNGFINRALTSQMQRDILQGDATVPVDGDLVLHELGIDPLTQKLLFVDIRTDRQYCVEAVQMDGELPF